MTTLNDVDATPAINVRAPILLAGEIEIAAAPELVWDVLTTIDDWPTWNSDVKAATLEGDLAEGSIFRWRSGTPLTSTITHVEPPRMISWTGTSMGLSAVHVYMLELREGKTFVRTEESVEGLLAHLLKRPLQKTMNKSIERGLRSLKAEAERLATTQVLTRLTSSV